jgi:tungstate transport system substrate-binding protein
MLNRRLVAFGYLFIVAVVALISTVAGSLEAAAASPGKSITLASTTSTDNSGLFTFLLPKFEAASGIKVRVVAVGTGAALRLGQRGDADVVLVHARDAELKFVAAGHGVDRREIMANDFVIVGPAADPAAISGSTDAVHALTKIAGADAYFASRGDDSGTHKAEQRLWNDAGLDPAATMGKWYLEAGAGMGATLNIAAGRDAYALTDRATWLAFKNPGELGIVVEGDARLKNIYGVMMVNPAHHSHVNQAAAKAFINWIAGVPGQQAISEFRIKGRQVFFPIAASGS